MRHVLYYFLLALLVIVFVFPMYWTFTLSLKTHSDIVSPVPKFVFKPTLMNYRGLFTGETGTTSLPASKPDFPRYFLNSFILSGMSTLLAIIIGVPAAYVLVRGKFKEESTRDSIAFTLLSFWFGPEIAIALPLYRIYQSIVCLVE